MNETLNYIWRMHPYLVQEDLKAYCDAKGIQLVAYTATGTPSFQVAL